MARCWLLRLSANDLAADAGALRKRSVTAAKYSSSCCVVVLIADNEPLHKQGKDHTRKRLAAAAFVLDAASMGATFILLAAGV